MTPDPLKCPIDWMSNSTAATLTPIQSEVDVERLDRNAFVKASRSASSNMTATTGNSAAPFVELLYNNMENIFAKKPIIPLVNINNTENEKTYIALIIIDI